MLISIYGYAVAAPTAQSIIPKIDPARIMAGQAYSVKPEPEARVVLPTEKKKSATPAAKKNEVRFKLVKVIISGSNLIPLSSLKPIYQPYIGKQVSLTDLHKITGLITTRYRRAGYILTQAVIPAQHIEHGIVKLQVIEGYVDKVNAKSDNLYVRRMLYAYGKNIMRSKPLRSEVLERNVLLINDSNGISVKTVVAPSKVKHGAADLTFVAHRKRFEGYASYNNQGTRFLGPLQMSATVKANTIFNATDQLGISTLQTPTNNEITYWQVFYNRPFGTNGFTVNTSYNQTITHSGFTLGSLGLTGESQQFMIGGNYPITRSRTKNFSLHLNFIALNTRTDYPNNPVPLYADRIRSLQLGAVYNLFDSWKGSNFVVAQFSQGLPIFGASHRDPAMPLSRSGGISDYTKFTILVSRLQLINSRFSLLTAVTGQYSADQLLSAEEFGFGGANFGRGYDPSEIIGDKGLAGKVELRFATNPGFALLRAVQYYVFWDIGEVWNNGSDIDQEDYLSAASAGAGLRINFTKHISGDLLLAKPLTYKQQTQVTLGRSGHDVRGFFNFSADI